MLDAEKVSQKFRVLEQIHAFSAAERRAFLTFLGPDRQGKNYQQLATAMHKARSIDQLERKGWSGIALRNGCSYILIKIIEFKARNSENPNYKLAEIGFAIELGVFSYARKLLLAAFGDAFASESMGLLWELYELEKRLRVRHGFEVIRHGEYLTADEFGREFGLMFKAQELRRRMRALVKAEPERRVEHHEALIDEVEELEYDFQLVRPRLEALKAIRGWYIVGLEYEMVAKKQEQILELMQGNGFCWVETELIEERLMMVNYLVTAQRFNAAKNLLEILEKEMTVNPSISPSTIGEWIRFSIVVGASRVDIGEGDRMEILLEKHNGKIPKHFRPITYHALSLMFAYERKWKKVISWQNKFSRIQESFSQENAWVTPLLKCIAYIELGDKENASGQLRNLFTTTNSEGSDYVKFNYTIMEELVESYFSGHFDRSKLKKHRSRLNFLSSFDAAKKNSWILNISTWLLSLEKSRPISQLVEEEGCQSLFSMVS